MKKYLYFCPKCHFLGSAEHEDPNEYQQCLECKSGMIYTGIAKTEWDTKSKEEKEAFKESLKEKAKSISMSNIDSDATVRILTAIHKDLSVIKNIIVGWVALTIIGAISILFLLN